MMEQSRRVFVRNLGKGVIFVATYPILQSRVFAARLEPTPPNSAGPFYRSGAPFQTNLREPGEPGTPLAVSGSVVDINDRPIPGALIELWHTDAAGDYDHRGWKHRAGLKTAAGGDYKFDTIMPGAYGGRPRHIHYKISAEGFEDLITQLYFEDDPFFSGDPVRNFRKDPLVQHPELIRPVIPFREGRPATVIFKICLA